MKDKVEIIKIESPFEFTVKINGLMHLCLMGPVGAVHSYIDKIPNTRVNSSDAYYKLYYIEFHLDNSVVKCTYNDRELWETILKGLE